MDSIRLQKYLAKCGLGSRRTCESYIEQGRVTVDGKKVTMMGTTIDPTRQVVRFDNTIVTPKPLEWIMLYKPPQYLSTSKDQGGKRSFLDLLPEEKNHLFAVGRLDFLSEGLLLITNDGDTANKLIHPRYEIEKEYLVQTADEITAIQQKKMQQGFITHNDFLSVRSISCVREYDRNYHFEYSIVITEGKNRHIRKMLNHLNIRIKRLKRIRIGPLLLTNIDVGRWRHLTTRELTMLYESVR